MLDETKYIEAPQTYSGNETSIFLAGGITGCPDWQFLIGTSLQILTDLVVFNPRRKNFVMHKDAAREQIAWEHEHLRKATAISFWFPHETLCPIVLYELGAWSMTDKKIFIGVDPGYQRAEDVQIQTALVRPDVPIAASLDELAANIMIWRKEVQA
jgi:hypothetical protein